MIEVIFHVRRINFFFMIQLKNVSKVYPPNVIGVKDVSLHIRPGEFVSIVGQSGSGKTTVGEALARALGWSFRDADDFHPPQNVAKMSAGTPLDDRDRQP